MNGVFFTGGALDLFDPVTRKLHPYTVTAQKILTYALDHTDNGDYFPIMGVCQGIELLHILVANDTDALGWSEFENQLANTTFTEVSSRLFSSFSPPVLESMRTRHILYHLHHRGIPTSFYTRFPALSGFFNILSNNTLGNDTIVSTCEAKKYPVYLTQYHPEIVYEPAADINASRGPEAYKVAFDFASFFAEECAKSGHKLIDAKYVKDGFSGSIRYIEDKVNAFGFDY